MLYYNVTRNFENQVSIIQGIYFVFNFRKNILDMISWFQSKFKFFDIILTKYFKFPMNARLMKLTVSGSLIVQSIFNF